jgi:hypothetical protein
MTDAKRRVRLANWLHETGGPYTTSVIVDQSGIYDGINSRFEKARVDLEQLLNLGMVRLTPAGWEHA